MSNEQFDKQSKVLRDQLVEKVCFFKKVLVLYPYKNALWALRPAKPLGVLSRHPCRKPLSLGKGLYYWGYRPYTLSGATPLRPHFYIIKRFIDSLKNKRLL